MAEAWIDILMEVRALEEPERVIIGNKIFFCNYGESLYSTKTWGQRWRWSPSKVQRVLNLFKKCGMIDVKNEAVTTRINVCNYGEYDIKRGGYEAHVKRMRSGCEADVKTNKKEKNVKKEKNKPPISPFSLPQWLTPETWQAWIEHRMLLKKPLTDAARKLTVNKLQKLKDQGQDPVAVIEQSIERGWLGLFAVHGDNGNKPPKVADPKKELEWHERFPEKRVPI